MELYSGKTGDSNPSLSGNTPIPVVEPEMFFGAGWDLHRRGYERRKEESGSLMLMPMMLCIQFIDATFPLELR